jgi:hypothetical protein
MFWQSRRERLQIELILILKDEVSVLRKLHDTDCQRIDRLTEALARRGNVDLVMPLPDPIPAERIFTPNPWKDPNLVTDRFPESVGVSADTSKLPTFSKEKSK